MTWKAAGQSVMGTSHAVSGKGCEDAIAYAVLHDHTGSEVLICCVSDGAGSALHADYASTYTVNKVKEYAEHLLEHKERLTDGHIYAMAEDIYYGLEQEATNREVPINEFSCTMLGCIITNDKAAFFQIGDGAIVRYHNNDTYTTVWWPQNGEYHNSTSFIVDDHNFGQLQVLILDERVNEVAIFTDGLQMLTLNMDSNTVFEPFFRSLFPHLRMADTPEKTDVVNHKLAEYLGSTQINDRTDDDKTLFLATRWEA